MNKIYSLFVAVICACVIDAANAESLIMPQFKIIRVIDGDTFVIDIESKHCDIDVLCKNLSVRVRGIDTPELHGKCYDERQKAKEAAQYLASRINRSESIELRQLIRDARFRIDADVFADGVDITGEVIELGLARLYDGKSKRLGWCG